MTHDDRDADAGARQRALVDSVPVHIWSADVNGTVDFLNRPWLDYTGLTVDQALGDGWLAAVHQSDRHRFLECLQSILDSGKSGDIEVRLRRADGEYRWFLFRGKPLLAANGTPRGWCGISTDIDCRPGVMSPADPIVDTIPAQLAVWTPGGQTAYVNQRVLEYFGRSLEDLQDWKQGDLIHPDDLPRVTSAWKDSISTGTTFRSEHRLRARDGEYYWFDVRAAPDHDEAGRIVRWPVLIIEIDDRKRAEAELLASEQRFRAMVDSIPALVAVVDVSTGEIEQVNRRTLEYFDRSLDELRDWTLTDAVHPDDLPSVLAAWRHALATGEAPAWEHRLRRFDGEYRWFQMRGFLWHDSDGRLPRWYIVLTDIHDRKLAEDALRRSERFLLEVQSLSKTGGWRLDLRTGLVEGSPELYRAYRVQPGDDVTDPEFFLNRVHPDDRADNRARLERSIREQVEYRVKCRILRGDGSIGFQHARGRPVVNEAGETVELVGAAMDMTEHWEAATELERASQALRDLESRLAQAAQVASAGELAASIAHEVNQPLASVVANGHACIRWLQHSPPNVVKALEAAERTVRDGKDAGEVVRRVRTLFKRAAIERLTVDLSDVVRDVMALVAADATRRGVEISSTLQLHGPHVVGDRIQLQQLVLNLVLNALDALDSVVDRQKLLAIRCLGLEASHAVVEVVDNGIGLDNVQAAFEPFYTTKTNGMGMGLAICRSIASAHDGTLTASRNDGFGTTFHFALPIENAVRGE
jgi:PAS domain S-box-containing protein